MDGSAVTNIDFQSHGITFNLFFYIPVFWIPASPAGMTITMP
jgi:hypothetical protein